MADVAVGAKDGYHAVGRGGQEIGLIGIPDTDVLNVKPSGFPLCKDAADFERVSSDRPRELLFETPDRTIVIDVLRRTARIEQTRDADRGEEPPSRILRRNIVRFIVPE